MMMNFVARIGLEDRLAGYGKRLSKLHCPEEESTEVFLACHLSVRSNGYGYERKSG